MKFFFLRHTSLDVGPDVFYGQTNLDVSSTFESELNLIKKKISKDLQNIEEFKVYSSPLKRCLKLAKRISDDVETDSRIKELNLGNWEMKPKSQIPKDLVTKWEKDIMNFQIPGGETNAEFLSRLKEFIDELISKKSDVLIVAHAGSINGMIANLTGERFDKLLKNYWEKIGYGSLSLIEGKSSSFKIKFIGK
tara:strand:+ start:364 stop:942 length:579 start_codon:yes stop_codon:yes gene_type:complete